MFKDKLKSDLDKLSPDNATKSAILQNIQTEAPKKAKILNIKATSVIAACLALVIALGVAVNSDFFSFESVKVDKNSSENKSNYDIIFNAVEKNYEDNKVGLFDNIFNGFGGKEEKYAYSETADTAATGTKGDAYEGEYSKTNTREENVDEEDIVKTDGKYIYRLSDDDKVIKIYKTDGNKTERISKIDFSLYLEDDRYVDHGSLLCIGR